MSDHVSTRPVALVTGAARGIGHACAMALAAAGFEILANDLDGPEDRQLLARLAASLASLGAGCLPFAADVSDLAVHPAMLRAALDRWGRLDCLVNNAGVGVLQRGDLLDATPASFDRCLAVNTRAVFFLSQLVARHLLAQGEIGNRHRSIVNVTSSNAVAASLGRGEYCVSKCASTMTTRLFALRLAEAGIGVYEIRPGIVATRMTEPVKAHYDALIADALVPMRRWGYPADVASAVVAMAEGRLPYTVGQAVVIDGGLTIPRF
jgi:NAD(P)-dependent dehydrogenase (short-subunit alcohol dehydrogenase family)